MKYTYRNLEEKYFSYYLEDLVRMGIVDTFGYETENIELTPKVEFDYVSLKTLKKSVKRTIKTKTFLREMTYTPDFVIHFNRSHGVVCLPETKKTFISMDYTLKTYVDIKGVFVHSGNNSAISFPLKQKFLYYTQGIYIQKIEPFALFKKTFTPSKMIDEMIYSNNRQGKWKRGDSKLKYTPVLIEDWLKSLK